MGDEPSSGSSGPGGEEKPSRHDGNDVVVLGKPTSDGEGVSVLRIRQGSPELGALRPLQHGKPIRGEVVTLHPREDNPAVCDVEVEVDARAPAGERSHAGPAQVATDRYRDGWDAIWSKKPATS